MKYILYILIIILTFGMAQDVTDTYEQNLRERRTYLLKVNESLIKEVESINYALAKLEEAKNDTTKVEEEEEGRRKKK